MAHKYLASFIAKHGKILFLRLSAFGSDDKKAGIPVGRRFALPVDGAFFFSTLMPL